MLKSQKSKLWNDRAAVLLNPSKSVKQHNTHFSDDFRPPLFSRKIFYPRHYIESWSRYKELSAIHNQPIHFLLKLVYLWLKVSVVNKCTQEAWINGNTYQKISKRILKFKKKQKHGLVDKILKFFFGYEGEVAEARYISFVMRFLESFLYRSTFEFTKNFFHRCGDSIDWKLSLNWKEIKRCNFQYIYLSKNCMR